MANNGFFVKKATVVHAYRTPNGTWMVEETFGGRSEYSEEVFKQTYVEVEEYTDEDD